MTEKHFAATHYEPRAEAYVRSQVHAAGEDLDEMEAALRGRTLPCVLDLGCGGGHVSYRAARYATRVVACDVTPAMLAAVARTAAAQGLHNIETCLAPAESLPFADEHFDAVLCRFTAHHWSDFKAGLREAWRVTKPGGLAVFMDTLAPESPLLDTHLQALELLRDPSHVRNYSAGQWCAALGEAGFSLQRCTVRPLPLDFASWTQRTRTPPEMVAAIRHLQRGAPDPVRRYLRLTEEGGFTLETATILLSR
jgi:SAM-dependent methyltransferase